MKHLNNLILKEIIVNRNSVKYKFSFSGEIASLFTADEMFVEYDQDVSDIPVSILTIPFVGSLIALTWLTDTVFWVKEIDETFYQSLRNLKIAYQELYPQCGLKGRFVSAKVVENHYAPDSNKDLLLFSGGVDAMTSYLRNIDKNLLLCNIQGWFKDENSKDAVAEKEFRLVSDFSELHKRQAILTKSNFATLVNEHAFYKTIGRVLKDSWWHGFSHSMSFISIAIPIAYKNNCKNILIASSFTIGDSRVCASYATTDIEFNFCSSGKTVHDGFELSRQDKLKVIVDHQKHNNHIFPLKVCSFKEANCCHCEKCFRTITGIVAEGGDPKDFGFDIKGNILNYFEEYFAHNLQFFGIKNESISHWPHIKERMISNMDNIRFKDFAQWFLTYDFVKARRKALRNYYSKNFFSILRRKMRLSSQQSF